jgi:hypothetical protein
LDEIKIRFFIADKVQAWPALADEHCPTGKLFYCGNISRLQQRQKKIFNSLLRIIRQDR